MVELNREFLVKEYGKDKLINEAFIIITDNHIRKIDSNTFKGLNKLRILDLYNNEIEEIDVKSFESLSNLKELSLNNNKLNRIDSNTFKGLTNLETLWLDNNEIVEIDVKSFESLSNLKALWLNNNKLKEIDRKCFERLKSIEVIEIYENEGLNALSFIKTSTKYCYDKTKIEKYGSISERNKFLQQFPTQLGKQKSLIFYLTTSIFKIFKRKYSNYY